MDTGSFLADLELRPLTLADAGSLEPLGLMIGPGSGGLEVAVARSERKPTQDACGWTTPVLLEVIAQGDRAALCGPAGEIPPVFLDLDVGQVERICRTALAEPNRHAAARFLWSVLPEVKESQIPGLRNQGLFATHELEKGVPQRSDWPQAQQKAREMADLRRADVSVANRSAGVPPASSGQDVRAPEFDDSTTHWDEVMRLFRVVNTGKPKEWGVPAYNGGMFSEERAYRRRAASWPTSACPTRISALCCATCWWTRRRRRGLRPGRFPQPWRARVRHGL